MAARTAPRPPARPRLPGSLAAATSWDAADSLGWADLELRRGGVDGAADTAHDDGGDPDAAFDTAAPSSAAGIDARGIDARGIDAPGVDARGVDAPGVDVSRCRLVGVSMIGAVLPRSRWVDVVFERCDLSGADLTGAALTRVEMHECRLNGALLGGTRLRDVHIVDGLLDGTHLRLAKGERIRIEGSRAVGIDLSGLDATEVVIAGCDLTGADVSHTRLPGLRLVGSVVDGLRGASSLRDAVIDADQVLPLGLALLEALEVTIDADAG